MSEKRLGSQHFEFNSFRRNVLTLLRRMWVGERKYREDNKPANGLIQIEYLLSPEGENDLRSLYQKVLADKYVAKVAIKPTLEQFITFWQMAKRGLEYARDKYGEKFLPPVSIYPDLFSEEQARRRGYSDQHPEFLAFLTENWILGLSYLYIAKMASNYGFKDRFAGGDKRLPQPSEEGSIAVVSYEDMTSLQFIEEIDHVYAFTDLGMKEEGDTVGRHDSAPVEVRINDVFRSAISDLSITVYAYDPKKGRIVSIIIP